MQGYLVASKHSVSDGPATGVDRIQPDKSTQPTIRSAGDLRLFSSKGKLSIATGPEAGLIGLEITPIGLQWLERVCQPEDADSLKTFGWLTADRSVLIFRQDHIKSSRAVQLPLREIMRLFDGEPIPAPPEFAEKRLEPCDPLGFRLADGDLEHESILPLPQWLCSSLYSDPPNTAVDTLPPKIPPKRQLYPKSNRRAS